LTYKCMFDIMIVNQTIVREGGRYERY
jgi:hypothetical protein